MNPKDSVSKASSTADFAGSNVVSIDRAKSPSQQELIDDVGAQAFVFLRDSALELDLPIKDVIVEHMAGLAMVMRSVEGLQETRKVMDYIGDQLKSAES